MFEAVEYVEGSGSAIEERLIGVFPSESAAVDAARRRRLDHGGTGDPIRYVWWIVRRPGARVAEWIADSRSEREFVLDLRSGRLVEV
jgi:hypothetical protein